MSGLFGFRLNVREMSVFCESPSSERPASEQRRRGSAAVRLPADSFGCAASLPAARMKMGVKKRIGWYSFRHGLGTMLRQMKVDVKVAQELLRHANPRVTLEFYQQAVTEEKREAQELALKGFLGPAFSFSTQKNPNLGKKEEVKPVIN
ncbi:MAG: hypothetical protein KGJ51_09480 [Acidobacteriota bacterium]|nr:hypothetical protein [Acidobacteriota bacterium]